MYEDLYDVPNCIFTDKLTHSDRFDLLLGSNIACGSEPNGLDVPGPSQGVVLY